MSMSDYLAEEEGENPACEDTDQSGAAWSAGTSGPTQHHANTTSLHLSITLSFLGQNKPNLTCSQYESN
jgi:hypothetical protein